VRDLHPRAPVALERYVDVGLLVETAGAEVELCWNCSAHQLRGARVHHRTDHSSSMSNVDPSAAESQIANGAVSGGLRLPGLAVVHVAAGPVPVPPSTIVHAPSPLAKSSANRSSGGRAPMVATKNSLVSATDRRCRRAIDQIQHHLAAARRHRGDREDHGMADAFEPPARLSPNSTRHCAA
jgi:hypothetical protein